jgi:hypothetical protein
VKGGSAQEKGVRMRNIFTQDQIKNKWQKIISIIRNCTLPITIFSLLWIPLIGGIALHKTGSFPEEFIGKDSLISVVNNFRYFVLKDRAFPQFITNGDGWFVYAESLAMDDFQNVMPLSSKDYKQIGTRLSLLCNFLTQNGIEFVFIVPPNKNTIYPEYVPSEISRMDSKSQLDRIAGKWQETDSCKMLDLRKPLAEAKFTSQVFYATDIHWNQNGILVGQRALLQVLSDKIPDQSSGKIDHYSSVTQEYSGDMLSKTFSLIHAPEIATFYSPIKQTSYWRQTIDSNGVYSWVSYNNDSSLPTVVAFHDSFMIFWVPFLSEIFREGHYYSTLDINPNIIIGEHPDIFLLEVNERGLAQLLNLPDENQYNLAWWTIKK